MACVFVMMQRLQLSLIPHARLMSWRYGRLAFDFSGGRLVNNKQLRTYELNPFKTPYFPLNAINAQGRLLRMHITAISLSGPYLSAPLNVIVHAFHSASVCNASCVWSCGKVYTVELETCSITFVWLRRIFWPVLGAPSRRKRFPRFFRCEAANSSNKNWFLVSQIWSWFFKTT